jgi:hypothetical protein
MVKNIEVPARQGQLLREAVKTIARRELRFAERLAFMDAGR